jgi:dephospho-CoA kinase
MIVAGLTGSIGMGKSAVARMLREREIPVHDADAEVHALLSPGGAAVLPVAEKFPGVFADGRIDRAALGRIVFADTGKRRALEAILHPLVRAASDAFVREARARGEKLAVLDIPLLFETGGEDRVDAIICVRAPPEVQRERVLARPGMTEEKFTRIKASQMPDEEKTKRADYVIDTGGTMRETRVRVEEVLAALLQHASSQT